MPGASLLSENCGKKCTCMGSQWSCASHQCSTGSVCEIDLDKQQECRVETVCPDYAEWTNWVSVNDADDGNERESAKKSFTMHPGRGFCQNPIAVRGRSRIERHKTLDRLIQGRLLYQTVLDYDYTRYDHTADILAH